MIVFLRWLAIGLIVIAVLLGGLVFVGASLDPKVATVEKTLPDERFPD